MSADVEAASVDPGDSSEASIDGEDPLPIVAGQGRRAKRPRLESLGVGPSILFLVWSAAGAPFWEMLQFLFVLKLAVAIDVR